MKTQSIQTQDITIEQAVQRIEAATKGCHSYGINFELSSYIKGDHAWEWGVYVHFDAGCELFKHPLLRGAVELAELHILSSRTLADLAGVSEQIPTVTTIGRGARKGKVA